MNDTDACFSHPWLRINHALRVMLHAHRRAAAKCSSMPPRSPRARHCRTIAHDN
jgi:hypothetical protein